MSSTPAIDLHSRYGPFSVKYHMLDNDRVVSLAMGSLNEPLPLVRIQSTCLFGESFEDTSCDCRPQLTESMKTIQEEGRGVLVYLFQEGRGVGLENKILSIAQEQSKGIDTVEAFKTLGYEVDARSFDPAAYVLRELDVSKRIRLISNNPRKRIALEKNGFTVDSMIALSYTIDEAALGYLLTKAHKMGHAIDFSKISIRKPDGLIVPIGYPKAKDLR